MTASYRQRIGLELGACLELWDQLADALRSIHAAGNVAVDLSENNVLYTPAGLRIIDCDSWQTPSAPATALTPAIRDPRLPAHARRFDPQSDWYAFAVLMCGLLAGVHPYKGRHPSVRGLEARTQARLSVFDPAVRVPPSARVRDVPTLARDWLAQVFAGDERPATPSVAGSHRPLRLRAHPGQLRDVLDFDGSPRVVASCDGALVVGTARALYLGRSRVCSLDAGAIAVGRVDSRDVYALCREGDELKLTLADASRGVIKLRAPHLDHVAQCGSRIVGLQRSRLVELEVRRVAGRVVAQLKPCRSVMPAARLFPGLLLEPMAGCLVASLPSGSAGWRQCRLPLPRGVDVVDACAEADVIVVVTPRVGGRRSACVHARALGCGRSSRRPRRPPARRMLGDARSGRGRSIRRRLATARAARLGLGRRPDPLGRDRTGGDRRDQPSRTGVHAHERAAATCQLWAPRRRIPKTALILGFSRPFWAVAAFARSWLPG